MPYRAVLFVQSPHKGRAMTSTPAVQHKLARICGMFGSAHDGERAVAAALADRLVRDAGLSWSDVIRMPMAKPKRDPLPDDQSGWQSMVIACLKRRDLFTEWEWAFLTNILSFRRISEKQSAVLVRLYTKASTL